MQETKLADDDDVPPTVFSARATSWPTTARGAGTGWRSRAACGIADVVTNFGEPLRQPRTPDVGDDEPLAEARMIAAACGGVRVVCALRAERPRRRLAVLPGQARLVRAPVALAGERVLRPDEPLVLGGDFNVAPADADVWDPAACHGGTHVSPPERAAFGAAGRLGPASTPTACTTRSPSATPGGTTGPATSTRTSACGSITCW